MKKLLLLFIFVSLIAAAQDVGEYSPRDYTIIPPSPEVASLMKYVDYPVSSFTGQPNITLPIYTIRQGDLELPISISYHGGGIKANEKSGIIGLGWTLNAGGCISRTVKGLPDEAPNCGSIHSSVGSSRHLYGIFNLPQDGKNLIDSIKVRRFMSDYAIELYNHLLPYSLCSAYELGRYDLSNDIFKFNCLGNTGTFIINQTGDNHHDIVMSTDSKVLFDNIIGRDIPASFIMHDSSKNTYIFSEIETTRFDYSYAFTENVQQYIDSVYYTSAWHINKIQSLSGDSILFNYFEGVQLYEYEGWAESLIEPADERLLQSYHSSYSNHIVYYPKRLQSIETTSTSVRFFYNGNMLTHVEVYRKDNVPQLIKRLDFIQSDNSNGTYLLTAVNELGIEDGSTTSDVIQLYGFRYAPILYPNSSAQDEWGYYNGDTTNSLIYGDRKPNEDATKQNILTMISYPTGGNTSFVWEQNDYAYISEIPISSRVENNEIVSSHTLWGKTGEQITRIDQIADQTCNIYVSDPDNTSFNIDMSKYVKPLFDSGCEFSAWSLFEHQQTDYEYTQEYATNLPRVTIVKPDMSTQTYIINRVHSSNGNILIPVTIAGTYTIKLHNPSNFVGLDENVINGYFGNQPEASSRDFGYVNIEVIKRNSLDIPNEKWGGLRIAEITSTASTGTTISKQFRYKDTFAGDVSSGTIAELPYRRTIYYYATQQILDEMPLGIHETDVISTVSNGLYSTPLGGSHVEYPIVWESCDGLTKTKYEYTSQRNYANKDDNSGCRWYDFIPGSARMLTSFDFLRGNLLSKKYYEGDELKKSERYEYNIHYKTEVPEFIGGLTRVFYMKSNNLSGGYADYAASIYRLYPYTKTTKERQSTEYFFGQNGYAINDTTTYSYFYDGYTENSDATLIRSVKNNESDLANTETFFTYWRSIPECIETEVKIKNDKIISAVRHEYDNKKNLIATYKAPTGLENNRNFLIGCHSYSSPNLLNAINIPEYSYIYDNHNNLVEIDYNGEVLACYIWGYKDSHPVAEIKGVSYLTALNTLQGRLNPETLRDLCDISVSEIDGIRLCFPDNEVTTYTYDWLIGAGTMTDPRGIPTTFTRDSFGRLESVKDFNGYFIRKYDYHYQGQNN